MNDEIYIESAEIEGFYRAVSRRVRRLRETAGISQLDMALSIGIHSVAFYSNCECTRYGKHFNLEHIYKIARILGVPIAELFADIDTTGGATPATGTGSDDTATAGDVDGDDATLSNSRENGVDTAPGNGDENIANSADSDTAAHKTAQNAQNQNNQ